MLRIVTGKINSGKTTTLGNIYKTFKGDGFISIKHMKQDKVHSYDILRLSTNETTPFILNENLIETTKPISCQIGPYIFLQDTLSYIEDTLKELIKNKVSPIYLDEIGLLELEDKCLHKIFTELLTSKLDLYVVIREDLIKPILNKYNILEYQIL